MHTKRWMGHTRRVSRIVPRASRIHPARGHVRPPPHHLDVYVCPTRWATARACWFALLYICLTKFYGFLAVGGGAIYLTLKIQLCGESKATYYIFLRFSRWAIARGSLLIGRVTLQWFCRLMFINYIYSLYTRIYMATLWISCVTRVFMWSIKKDLYYHHRCDVSYY